MRKIIMIAAVLGFAGAAAFADDPAPVAPASAQQGPAYVQGADLHILYSGITPDQYLDISFSINNGPPIRVMGDCRQNFGDLFPPNPYNPIPNNRAAIGSFVKVGDVKDQAILIEVQNPAGRSVLGLFIPTVDQSGLSPAVVKMFFTTGFELKTWLRDMRTAGLNSTDLAFHFNEAPTADLFFNYLRGRMSPRDVVARPLSGCGTGMDCGGGQVIGGPVVGVLPSRVDPTLSLGNRY